MTVLLGLFILALFAVCAVAMADDIRRECERALHEVDVDTIWGDEAEEEEWAA